MLLKKRSLRPTGPRRFEVGSHQVSWRGAPMNLTTAIFLAAQFVGFQGELEAKFFALAALLLYPAIARGVNRGQVSLDGRFLRVRYGPLPARRGLCVPKRSVARIDCTRSVPAGSGYEVIAQLRDGSDRIVADGLDDFDDAKFLARQVRKLLHLRAPSRR